MLLCKLDIKCINTILRRHKHQLTDSYDLDGIEDEVLRSEVETKQLTILGHHHYRGIASRTGNGQVYRAHPLSTANSLHIRIQESARHTPAGPVTVKRAGKT
jgi:hypothetical protein